MGIYKIINFAKTETWAFVSHVGEDTNMRGKIDIFDKLTT